MTDTTSQRSNDEQSTTDLSWTDRNTLGQASFGSCCLMLFSILAYAAKPAYGYIISVLLLFFIGFFGIAWPFLLIGLTLIASSYASTYICDKLLTEDWFWKIYVVVVLSLATIWAALLKLLFPLISEAYGWDPNLDAMARKSSSVFNVIMITVTMATVSFTLAGWLVHANQQKNVTGNQLNEQLEGHV